MILSQTSPLGTFYFHYSTRWKATLSTLRLLERSQVMQTDNRTLSPLYALLALGLGSGITLVNEFQFSVSTLLLYCYHEHSVI